MNVNEIKYESLNHGDPLFALSLGPSPWHFQHGWRQQVLGRQRVDPLLGLSQPLLHLEHWSTVTISWRFMEHHGVTCGKAS